jgi:hypothetical protein
VALVEPVGLAELPDDRVAPARSRPRTSSRTSPMFLRSARPGLPVHLGQAVEIELERLGRPGTAEKSNSSAPKTPSEIVSALARCSASSAGRRSRSRWRRSPGRRAGSSGRPGRPAARACARRNWAPRGNRRNASASGRSPRCRPPRCRARSSRGLLGEDGDPVVLLGEIEEPVGEVGDHRALVDQEALEDGVALPLERGRLPEESCAGRRRRRCRSPGAGSRARPRPEGSRFSLTPAAVWPALAPPLTFMTTVTGLGVLRSSSTISGIRRPLPSSPREMPTSAMSWLVKGSSDMVRSATEVMDPCCRDWIGQAWEEGKPQLSRTWGGPSVRPGRHLDDVVRAASFWPAGLTRAKRAFSRSRKRLGAQVAHPALDAADQVREHLVHRAADLLEGLDPLGGDLPRVVAIPAVAGGAARPSSRRASPCPGTACRPCPRFP